MGNKKKLIKTQIGLMDLEIEFENLQKKYDEIFKQRNLMMHFFTHLKGIVRALTVAAVIEQQKGNDMIENEVNKYLFVHNVHVMIDFFSKLFRKECSMAVFTKPSVEFNEAWQDTCAKLVDIVEANKKKIRDSLTKLLPKKESYYQ